MMQLPPILSALCWCERKSNLYLLYDKNWNLRVLRWRDFQNSFGSNFPPHPGTFQILHSRSAFCVKFPTPWVRTTVKYPKVAGEGRGMSPLRVERGILQTLNTVSQNICKRIAEKKNLLLYNSEEDK